MSFSTNQSDIYLMLIIRLDLFLDLTNFVHVQLQHALKTISQKVLYL